MTNVDDFNVTNFCTGRNCSAARSYRKVECVIASAAIDLIANVKRAAGAEYASDRIVISRTNNIVDSSSERKMFRNPTY